MKEKWENLLKHLEIRAASYAVSESFKHLEIEPDLNLKPCNEIDITKFEAKQGIILPSEYKMFCQVFGSVTFGHEVYIRCTGIAIESDRDFAREILLYRSGDGGYNDFDNVERESFDKISELVDHGMRFGSNEGNGSDFWFDLRTYGADESYDIYCVYTGGKFDLCKLPVRNFFDFISEYCLGTKLYEPDLAARDTIPCEPHEFFISPGD
jgi:hypothetical protein